MQQNCASASVFSNREYGLHHCAAFATDLSAELDRLAEAGHATAMTANTLSGVQFAFVSGAGNGSAGAAPLGHYLELYEDQPGIRSFYAMVEAEAKNWNGENPLRSL